MNLYEAKRILNNNGYFLKEDASPEWVAEEIMKHYYEHEPITVDYIDDTNYEDYIGEYINVKKNVDLDSLDLTKLPIRFGTVGGNFYCSDNKLTSLEGAPERVGGNFYCSFNMLTSLEGAPERVGGSFGCSVNKLTSLKGAPKVVGRDFNCSYNKLTSLKGVPKEIVGNFNCFNNNAVKFTEDDVLKVSNVKGKINL